MSFDIRIIKFIFLYTLILFLRAPEADAGQLVKSSGQFPFMVCIYDKQYKHCIGSGALIKATLVVTAASCLRGINNWQYDKLKHGLQGFAAIGGVVDIEKKTDDSMVDIVNYEVHCEFKKVDELFVNDVATVELKNPFKQKSIKPTRVIGDKGWYRMDWNDFVTRGMRCTMIGWEGGSYQYVDGGKDLLMFQLVPKSDFGCRIKHRSKKYITEGYICGTIIDECKLYMSGAVLYCNNNVYGVRTPGEPYSCNEADFYLFTGSLDDLDLLMPEQRPKSDASAIDSGLKMFPLIALNLKLMKY